VVTGATFPCWPRGHGYAFVEFARRHGDFAIVSAAVLIEEDKNGKVTRASVTLGGMGPRASGDRPAAPRAHQSARTHRPRSPLMSDTRQIAVTVNGTRYEETVPVRVTLADFLRHQLGLTGTHLGCEHGVCGACTILLDGRSARSCLMLAVQADGHEILTVEGIAPDAETLHPLQEAFRDNHGLQCGFCTPGILTTLIEFLRDNPDPTEEEVRIGISGNLCRCTGY